MPVLLAFAIGGPAAAHAEPGPTGVMADAGVPDGLVGALTLRAHSRIRFHVGAGHNSISPGVRGGVSLSAFDAAVQPYLAVEAGRYFQGQAKNWTRGLAGRFGFEEGEIETVGYDFARD